MTTEANVEEEAGETVLEEGETPAVDEATKLVEERARRQGWRPKDQYSGDPSRWVDAQTFMARSEQEMPIMRERFRKLDSELAATRKTLGETEKKLTESTEVLIELRDMSRQSQQRGYEQAMAEIRDREARAVADADVDTWKRLQIDKDAVERTRPKVMEAKRPEAPVAPAAPQTNPVIDQWVSENQWFKHDPLLNQVALAFDAEVERENPYWTLEDKLAEVKRRIVVKFPEKFENTRRTAPSAVASPSSVAPLRPKTNGKGVKDLPADAKQALERFKKMIPGYKDEDYLKTYQWD